MKAKSIAPEASFIHLLAGKISLALSRESSSFDPVVSSVVSTKLKEILDHEATLESFTSKNQLYLQSTDPLQFLAGVHFAFSVDPNVFPSHLTQLSQELVVRLTIPVLGLYFY